MSPMSATGLRGFPQAQFATAAFYIDLLAEHGPLLGEPYSKQLSGKLRELRFHLDGRPWGSATGSPPAAGSSC